MAEERLLAEQIAYYRARAAEYDVTSMPADDPHNADGERLRAILRRLKLRGRVLEVAAGTGQWTALLAEGAETVVATDSSPEMLDLNRAKHAALENVRYEVADAFGFRSAEPFDEVFFGFFLSHVPLTRFRSFWSTVASVLQRDGRAVFVDEGDPGVWEEEWEDRRAGVVRRRLRDGSVHRAVKVLWVPAQLEAALAELGWRASVRSVGPFYLGTATR